jgi:hypothetical protein
MSVVSYVKMKNTTGPVRSNLLCRTTGCRREISCGHVVREVKDMLDEKGHVSWCIPVRQRMTNGRMITRPRRAVSARQDRQSRAKCTVLWS